MIPLVVSFAAITGLAGPTRATKTLVSINNTRNWLRARPLCMNHGAVSVDLIIGMNRAEGSRDTISGDSIPESISKSIKIEFESNLLSPRNCVQITIAAFLMMT